MTCYYPNDAYIDGVNTNGNKLIKFGLSEKNNVEYIKLPCGQCIGCRLDRSIMWAARCMHESQMHAQSQFITLTYETEPQYGSLNPVDFVKFMKRYRKSISPLKIRFFHGAEYGELLQRPHHHACIFGHDFTDKEIHSENEGIFTYYSPTLEKLWGHGYCTTGELTIHSAAYVARYCMKKITASQQSLDKYHDHYISTDETTGEILTKIPEYATMSRKPGIGRTWYSKYHSDIFPHDTCIIHGKTLKTPRYYENLLRSADLPAFEALKANRKIQALKSTADNTPSRLRAREKVKQAQFKQLGTKIHAT